MVEFEKKLIYIAIPKTASGSVRSIFQGSLGVFSKYGGPEGCHSTYMDAKKEILEINENINEYFSFSFVRNPWDRFVSQFLHPPMPGMPPLWVDYLKNLGAPHRPWRLPGPDEFRGTINEKLNFFIKNILNEPFFMSTYEEALMFWPQTDFICDNKGEMRIDFIGRFENLQEDFNVVCDKIGIDARPLPHLSASKPKIKPYRQYYTEKTKKIVAEKYKKDIEYFGYKF
jgi:chondroitin 4-sulfotransferase 11|tara:strand:- start:218 stop:901 length:684 start_codon:yes stop_codon:yes gene_type:complete